MDKTIFISLPIEDLQTVIIDCVNSCLRNNKQEHPRQEPIEKLLSIKEASEYLNLTVPTLYGKVSKKEIPFMKRGKRLYFSSVELLNYLKEGKVKTNLEIEAEANAYSFNSKTGSNGKF